MLASSSERDSQADSANFIKFQLAAEELRLEQAFQCQLAEEEAVLEYARCARHPSSRTRSTCQLNYSKLDSASATRSIVRDSLSPPSQMALMTRRRASSRRDSLCLWELASARCSRPAPRKAWLLLATSLTVGRISRHFVCLSVHTGELGE